MNITITIEELVVEGIPLSPSERPLLARVVQRELTRLYARDRAGNVAPRLQMERDVPQDITYTTPVSASALGRQVAGAIHRALQR
jgi:hypothetical protein